MYSQQNIHELMSCNEFLCLYTPPLDKSELLTHSAMLI